MAIRQLPACPSLKSLKNQTKQLLHAHHGGQNDACDRIRTSHPGLEDLDVEEIKESPFALADARLVVAREYGFDSWPKLTDALFAREQHFANEPGWEWVLSPNLDHPIGSSGTTGSNGCLVIYNNKNDCALSVYLAVEAEFSEKDYRPIVFDEEGKRYCLQCMSSCGGEKSMTLYEYALPSSGVSRDRIRYLGIEAKKG